MNRKLQTASFTLALGTALGVFALSAPPAVVPGAEAPAAHGPALGTVEAAGQAVSKARRVRRVMAMPFFSFVARG